MDEVVVDERARVLGEPDAVLLQEDQIARVFTALGVGGRVTAVEAHGERGAALLGEAHQPFRRAEFIGERLVDVGRHPGVQQRRHDPGVGLGRGVDERGVEPLGEQRLQGGVPPFPGDVVRVADPVQSGGGPGLEVQFDAGDGAEDGQIRLLRDVSESDAADLHPMPPRQPWRPCGARSAYGGGSGAARPARLTWGHPCGPLCVLPLSRGPPTVHSGGCGPYDNHDKGRGLARRLGHGPARALRLCDRGAAALRAAAARRPSGADRRRADRAGARPGGAAGGAGRAGRPASARLSGRGHRPASAAPAARSRTCSGGGTGPSPDGRRGPGRAPDPPPSGAPAPPGPGAAAGRAPTGRLPSGRGPRRLAAGERPVQGVPPGLRQAHRPLTGTGGPGPAAAPRPSSVRPRAPGRTRAPGRAPCGPVRVSTPRPRRVCVPAAPRRCGPRGRVPRPPGPPSPRAPGPDGYGPPRGAGASDSRRRD